MFDSSFHFQQTAALWTILLLTVLLATGCAWEPQTASVEPSVTVSTDSQPTGQPQGRIRPSTQEQSPRERAANLAAGLVGTPYRWGGASPEGFDCSGLIHFVYARSDISVPRTAAEQQGFVRTILLRDAQPGDLLFFDLRTKNDHVAIYLGDQTFIHAPSKGKTVQRQTLRNPYYRQRLTTVGRVQLKSSSP